VLLQRAEANDPSLVLLELAPHMPRFVRDLSQLASRVARALISNTVLTRLDLDDCHFGPAGVSTVLESLRSNSVLTSLLLFDNDMGPHGASRVVELLGTSPSLSKLVLGNNELGDLGVSSVFDALKNNTSMTDLDVSGNGIYQDGARSFADMLLTNRTLATVWFAHNEISSSGACAVANALSSNSTLTALDLSGNHMVGVAGACSLGDALRTRAPPFLLRGIKLRRASLQLALPQEALEWNNNTILSFWFARKHRSVAFCMLTHIRLGLGSMWSELDAGLLQMVLGFPTHFNDASDWDNSDDTSNEDDITIEEEEEEEDAEEENEG